LGSNGDFYLDLANSDVYNKVSGSWTKVANIQGATGATGATGPAGPQGPPGVGWAGVNEIGSSSDIPTTARNLGMVTVNAPTNGYVFVIATAYVVTFGDGTECVFGLGTTAGSFNLHSTRVGVLDGTGTQRREFSVTSTALVPVTAGSRNFYVTAQKPSVFSAQTVNIGNIYATALFCGT
jgi:hypothetical protein